MGRKARRRDVDIEATTKMQKLQKRKVALEKRKAKEKIQSETMTKAKSIAKTNLKLSTEGTDTGDEAAEESICKDDDNSATQEYDIDSDCSNFTKVPQMRISLRNLAREADRFGFSNQICRL